MSKLELCLLTIINRKITWLCYKCLEYAFKSVRHFLSLISSALIRFGKILCLISSALLYLEVFFFINTVLNYKLRKDSQVPEE